MNFDQIIDRLLDEGIEIRLSKKEGLRWYDLDTGMKSGLLIAEESEGVYRYQGRYFDGLFKDYGDLLREVKECRCGRDYANSKWLDLLTAEGLLTKVTQTTVTYE
jgi:hypothetical protein